MIFSSVLLLLVPTIYCKISANNSTIDLQHVDSLVRMVLDGSLPFDIDDDQIDVLLSEEQTSEANVDITTLGRRLQDIVKDEGSKISLLSNYGCWCNFDAYKGQGLPQDYLDNKCKSLFNSYYCGTEDLGCDVSDQVYEGAVSIAKTLGKAIVRKMQGNVASALNLYSRGLRTCKSDNKNDICKASACQIEFTFLFETAPQIYLTIDEDPQGYNSDYVHGSFDNTACRNANSAGTLVQSCCGKVPYQFVYNSENTNVECCMDASATYNPITQCCTNRGVVPCSN